MEIRIRKDKKRVEIWLTHCEAQDDALQASLLPIYEVCKRKQYLAVVYKSGTGDMVETMTALLRHNREIQAAAMAHSSSK